MSLADLASLGSFVSGIAVLVSLLYLNVQVRQSAKHSRAAIGHGFVTRTVDFNYRMIDANVAAVLVKGRSASTDLTEVELFQFLAYSRAAFWNIADTFLQHRDGLMDDAIFTTFERAHVGAMRSRGMQIAWTFWRANFTPDIVAFVDRIAKTAEEQGYSEFAPIWTAAIAAKNAAPEKA